MDHILSLCTGIGGLDIGLHAGLRAVGHSPRTVCYVEREAFAVACLGKAIEEGRLDDAPIWLGDLQLMPLDLFPRIDIITGGYPCQPFSSAGTRKGENDDRHLWPSVLETVRALRPRGVFFENVAGHISLGLFDVLSDLESSGYRTAWGCYSAASVGAPHRRERVFILGLADSSDYEPKEPEGDDGLDGKREEIWRRELLDARIGAGRRDERGNSTQGTEGNEFGPSRAGDTTLMADAASVNRGSRSAQQEDREESSARGELADACRRRQHETAHKWPSSPGDRQGTNEPSRTIEPRLGGNAHGLPDRVDRLRALGNSVVPQQAEMAFIDLWNQLQ